MKIFFPIIFFATTFLILGSGCGQTTTLRSVPPQEFSDQYRILYVQDPVEVAPDGSPMRIYSILSNGTEKQVVKEVSTAQWDVESAGGVYESMGKYVGDTRSPDGQQEIIAKSGLVPFFSKSRLFVRSNRQDQFFLEGDFFEFEWFPDSRGFVFAGGNQIGVIDLEKKIYVILGQGVGFFKVETVGQ